MKDRLQRYRPIPVDHIYRISQAHICRFRQGTSCFEEQFSSWCSGRVLTGGNFLCSECLLELAEDFLRKTEALDSPVCQHSRTVFCVFFWKLFSLFPRCCQTKRWNHVCKTCYVKRPAFPESSLCYVTSTEDVGLLFFADIETLFIRMHRKLQTYKPSYISSVDTA